MNKIETFDFFIKTNGMCYRINCHECWFRSTVPGLEQTCYVHRFAVGQYYTFRLKFIEHHKLKIMKRILK